MSIDLNCDLGEGAAHDAELMPLITAANVACGGHAGDPATMRSTMELARQHGVAVGAHPGFEDREHFGRRELDLGAAAVQQLVERQVATLAEIGPIRHVKLHGALYHLAARDRTVAAAVVAAVRACNPALILFAPAGSALARAGAGQGLPVAAEVFADRTYAADGSLTPRSRGDALVSSEAAMVAQLLQMLRSGTVRATSGEEVPIVADTLCLHGDGPQAVPFARRIRAELIAAGIAIRRVFASA